MKLFIDLDISKEVSLGLEILKATIKHRALIDDKPTASDDESPDEHASMFAKNPANTDDVPGLTEILPATTGDEPDNSLDAPKLDKDSFPWDARIHSGGKTFVAAGTWKLMKMPKEHDKETWSAYIDQCRGLAGTEVETSETVNTNTGEITNSFEVIVAKVTEAIVGGSLDVAKLTAVCNTFGVSSINDTKDNPKLTNDIYNALFNNG